MHSDFGLLPGYVRDDVGKPVIGLDDVSVYGFGHLIRSVELLILDLFGRGLLSGTTHTCLGQELCQMAVVRALGEPNDMVLSNHRNHGHFLTYSGQPVGLVAEIMGRQNGICGGYGGSQHIAYRNFHSNGVQAGMTAIGSGLALDRKRRASPGIVAIMVGDGTLGEGLLYESMNLAAVWHAPVLFVVEHNGIAQTTCTRDVIAGSIVGRGAAFGLRTWTLNDAAPDFMQEADLIVRQMRDGKGPGMLVIETRRLGPHSKGDDLRDPAERAAIAHRDPLEALGRRLDLQTRARIEARNQALVNAVEAAALASPESHFVLAPEHIMRPVRDTLVPQQPAVAASVRVALNAALRDLLVHCDRVLLLGEDLHDPYGGAFKVTAGLSTDFPGRVISTPISEAGITGAGIGLAMAGRLPIVEIMFADFLTLCMDQIYNHAVKFPGMFEDCDVPLVVRAPCGGRRGYGPTHSQSPENILVSIPGLTVVYGSHRHNVGQLLVNATTRWPNPTVFLEHKLLYAQAQDPQDYHTVVPHVADLGGALFPTLRRGDSLADVTFVCFGGMLSVVESASERLEREEELSIEIVVPSLLAPLPRLTLLGLLASRPRIAVVEESHHEFGVSAELLASLAEAGYQGKVLRIGMPPVPIASARSLEGMQIPDEQTIINSVLAWF
jgi:2-oxoisovalerate dehydrogenase E1 component